MAEHISDRVTRDDLKILTDDDVRKLVGDLEHYDDFDFTNYTPPGPVAQEFILSSYLTPVIMGPLGGGKTTACAFKRIFAATQAPIARHPKDKKPTKMCRWLVLRDTFRSAEKTVLESWKQWFPKGYPGSEWAGGNDRPVTHTLRFIDDATGIRIEAITEFAGLNDMDVETLMKGREYSGVWLNELDTHAEGALEDAEQRVGRYPMASLILSDAEVAELAKQLRVPLRQEGRKRYVIGDMNAPTVDSWTYKTFKLNPTADRFLFEQPSGRSANAENRFNLEPDYYERIIRNQDDWFVKRMVDNLFGYSRSGKPVYESFEPGRHIAGSRLEWRPGLDLNIGIDISTSGLSPAAIFAQAWAPRIAVLDELYLGHGVGPARFGEGLKQKLDAEYPGARLRVWVDPAAIGGADTEGGQLAALEQLQIILGVPILIPANGSNEIGLRLMAVSTELRGYHEPHSHLIVCPEKCPLLIQGFSGKYRYKKKTEKASNEYDDTPEKIHPWADVHDALQYDVLGIRGRTAAIRNASDVSGGRDLGSSPWGGHGRQGGGHRGGFDPRKAGL